ncbi:MAG: hypothetical protein IJA73_04700 [Oscillospiraceae bacterium]|nr:hypothetical protein [Oscillospiraceae bacterium]
MTQRIFALASVLCAVTEQENEALELLCEAAERELTERLRAGVAPEDCAEAFVCAGAWIAASGILTSRACASSGEVKSFRAGEVSVELSAEERSGSAAVSLRREAERLMRPYIKDSAFGFFGVQG